MRVVPSLLVALCLLAITGCRTVPRTQPATADPRAADIEVLLDAYNREGLFNGIAMVADDGRVIFEKSYGYANEEWGMRPDRHTKFRLASITKQFTALMILQLAEEGKLSLDDTITKHLPWYRQDTGSRITIHQLLTHTSGIPNYSDFSGFFSTGPSRMHYEMREFVEKYCSNDLASEPGESYAYCNSGYYILGAILEEIEGKPWEQVVDERIAQRGGMPDTGAYSHTRLMPRRAQGYRRDSDGTLQPTGHQDMTIWRAAGSMYSTGQDMLQWDRALRENLLLGAEWKEKMFSRQRGSYGYGVNVIRIENPSGETIRYMGHSGSYAGFNNYFCHFPDTGEAVVLLNNGGRTEINAIRDGIANILVGNPYDLPVATHRLTSEGDNPRLAVAKISSQGVISSDDATFQPADAAAGTTIYATNFLLHDGEQVYFANASGGAARIRDGQVHSTAHSLHNRGMTYSGSAWLESDLDIEVTGTDAPRLALSWTFHNRGTEERALRMMWFTDVDLTTAGSSSSHDRLALLPKPGRPGEKAMLVFNHSEPGEIDRGSGLLFHVQGVPHHFLGIAGDAGASGYWRSSGPFESIGPRAAGYQIPEDWRGKVQHDEDGDGMTDGPRDVGVSVQADISLPVGASRTVRFLVDFGPRD